MPYVLGAIIAALLLVGVGYVIVDRPDDDVAVEPTPTPTPTPLPTPEPTPEPEPDPEPEPEPEPEPDVDVDVEPDPDVDPPEPDDREVADARPTDRMPDTGGGGLAAGLLLAGAGLVVLRRR